MTSGFHVDTGLVGQTSQKASNSADTIIGFFRKMDADTQNVLSACKGTMFAALIEALTDLQTQRDRLIPQLQSISAQLKQGGLGMDSQDQGGASGIRGQVQPGLKAPINQPR
jgi:uncharacterized protein YukE